MEVYIIEFAAKICMTAMPMGKKQRPEPIFGPIVNKKLCNKTNHVHDSNDLLLKGNKQLKLTLIFLQQRKLKSKIRGKLGWSLQPRFRWQITELRTEIQKTETYFYNIYSSFSSLFTCKNMIFLIN